MTRAGFLRSIGALALMLGMAAPAKSQTINAITQPTGNPIWGTSGTHAVVFTWTGGHSAVIVKCLIKSTGVEYSGQSFGPQTSSPSALTLTGFGADTPGPGITQCVLRVELIDVMGQVASSKEVDV